MNSTQLVQVLQVLFPAMLQGANGYTIAVDSSGNASILLWNNALGVQPTVAQLTAELAALQLAQAKQAQLAILGAAYQAAMSAPISYMGTTFANDPAHQQVLSRAVQAFTLAGAVPSGFFVPDINNVKVSMTLAQLQGMVPVVSAAEWAATQTWVSVQEQVAAATTISAVQAVVW